MSQSFATWVAWASAYKSCCTLSMPELGLEVHILAGICHVATFLPARAEMFLLSESSFEGHVRSSCRIPTDCQSLCMHTGQQLLETRSSAGRRSGSRWLPSLATA